MRWNLAIAAIAALFAFSAPAFATDTMTGPMTGHHACMSGGKKGGCTHHYMGHHTTMSGGKKGSSMHMGHHATSSGNKKSDSMSH